MDNIISGKLTGESITQKVYNEIKKLTPKDTEDFSLDQWFRDITGVIMLSTEVVDGFELIRAAALALVEDTWDDLSLDIRKAYNYQFRVYAQSFMPTLDWSTISNHIRAARTFLLENHRPDTKVSVIKRTEDRQPIMKDGEPVVEYIEFDPLKIPISKLVLARSIVSKGTINDNPELWSKLADDGVTWDEFRHEMISDKSKSTNNSPDFKFELLGPVLVAVYYGEEAVIVDDSGFNWMAYYDEQHEQHEVVKKAIDRILAACQVMPDEEVMYQYFNRRYK